MFEEVKEMRMGKMSFVALMLLLCATLAWLQVFPARATTTDVAITAVITYPLTDTLPEVATPAHTIWFGIGILNNGTNNVYCNVTIYINTLPKIVLTNYLSSAGTHQTLIQSMSTATIGKGTWTVSAMVSAAGDPTPADNYKSGDTFKIGRIGDVNCDGKVDMRDIVMVTSRAGMGNATLNPIWLPEVDTNRDNKIDMRDIMYYSLRTDYYNITRSSMAFGSSGPHGSPEWLWAADLYRDGRIDSNDWTIAQNHFGEHD